MNRRLLALLVVATACGGRSAPSAGTAAPAAAPVDAGALLGALAADSMEGRGTATRGGDRAATFIAERMQEYGLVPAGDSGWFQRVPLAVTTGPDGRRTLALVSSSATPEATVRGGDVVGMGRGSDPPLPRPAGLDHPPHHHLRPRPP